LTFSAKDGCNASEKFSGSFKCLKPGKIFLVEKGCGGCGKPEKKRKKGAGCPAPRVAKRNCA
jgi:hypothetical protein